MLDRKPLSKMWHFLITMALFIGSCTQAFGATIVVPDQYPSIQGAIDAALTGDTVMVRDGTYFLTAALDYQGKAITVRSENGARNCILDAQQQTRVVYFHSNESNSSALSGFTLQNGRSTDGKGGGIYCDSSSPTITNCLIRLNVAYSTTEAFGGGIYCNSSTALITDCTISSNQAYTYNNSTGSYGGGIYCGSSSPTIANCTIVSNSAIFDTNSGANGGCSFGGGMYCEGGSPSIIGCMIIGNSASTPSNGYMIWSYGGGICCISSSPSIKDCTISNNSTKGDVSNGGGIYCLYAVPSMVNTIINGNAAKFGAGMYLKDSSSFTSLTNCTIVRNTATTNGGSLYCENTAPDIVNSILWQGSPEEIFSDAASSPTVTYSTVTGGYAGVGNISASPAFVNIAGQDFHLTAGSPCINVGDNGAPELPDRDKDRHPRIAFGAVDMGAYEYQGTGSLSVTILPSTAVAAGAQWRVDGGGWHTSGDTVTDLAVGQHPVELSSLSGWNKPPSVNATINQDQTTTITVSYVQQTVKPTVKITAATSKALEKGCKQGKFKVTRNPVSGKALIVSYTVSGSATNGVDDNRLSGKVTIPAGAGSANVIVKPIDDTLKEGDEVVTVTIKENSRYIVGSSNAATIVITDND